MNARVIIRPSRASDLDRLEHHIPSPGSSRYHDVRFQRQEQGLSTLLVAFDDEVPVGSGEVIWSGCAAPEVRRRYAGCPELSGLTVWPPHRQSQGIGTLIIGTAEALATARGLPLIGLGVDDQNTRAAALYRRLGYRDTDCPYLDRYHYTDEAGVRHEVADPCRFLVKHL